MVTTLSVPYLRGTPVMPEERRLYSVREAHELLNISRAKFYLLVNTCKIETVKVGSRRLVPREALDEFIARLRKMNGDNRSR